MTFDRTQAMPLPDMPLPSLLRRVWDRVHFQVLPGTFAIAFGMTLTLCVRGYQFGGSNHNVYLIDALHQASGRTLLANDWFTTDTLQYHAVFGLMTRNLYRTGMVEPAFLAGQLLLIFLMHLAWFRLTLRLGGTRITYLLSVVLFYVMAGGLGLGVYEFMQDQAFLPSNIANVAMLWGLYFWIARKPGWAGVWLGVSGLFHLNHALVAIGLWFALNGWRMLEAFLAAGGRAAPHAVGGRSLADGQADTASSPSSHAPRPTLRQRLAASFGSTNPRGFIIGSVMVLGISIGNVLIAMAAVMAQQRTLPFDQFVNLYVKLRHAHHYYPISWPLALWICFLLPIPFAVWAYVRGQKTLKTPLPSAAAEAQPRRYALQQTGRIFLLFSLLLIISLIGAGFWYVSEPLVKLSFYRFSIYVKLLSCIGTAYLLYDAGIWDRRIVRCALIALPILLGGTLLALILSGHTGWQMLDWLASFVWRHRGVAGLAVILCAVLAIYELIYARPWKRWRHDVLHAGGIVAMAAVLLFAWGRWLQVRVLPEDEAAYLRLCQWAQRHTPVDAVFLVPPHEQSFRLHAQRAIVVNFKGVPQLNAEIVPWRDRLQDVLALEDLMTLRGKDFYQTLEAVDHRYRALPASHLLDVARRYNASYLVTPQPLAPTPGAQLQHSVRSDSGSGYYLYSIQ